MSILLNPLLIPGWAFGESALPAPVSATYKQLPCHTTDPELFFSETQRELDLAKRICGPCPLKAECLTGAIARSEPCGVWGGEIFDRGVVVPAKRMPGRPRKNSPAAA